MDLIKFHEGLFGNGPTITQQRLYDAYPDGKRGFGWTGDKPEEFLGALVVAMYQTQPTEMSIQVPQVAMLIPHPLRQWALQKTHVVARHIVRRFKNDKAAVDNIRQCFQAIRMAPNVPVQPPRWASYGFGKEQGVPQLPRWLKDGLL